MTRNYDENPQFNKGIGAFGTISVLKMPNSSPLKEKIETIFI